MYVIVKLWYVLSYLNTSSGFMIRKSLQAMRRRYAPIWWYAFTEKNLKIIYIKLTNMDTLKDIDNADTMYPDIDYDALFDNDRLEACPECGVTLAITYENGREYSSCAGCGYMESIWETIHR